MAPEPVPPAAELVERLRQLAEVQPELARELIEKLVVEVDRATHGALREQLAAIGLQATGSELGLPNRTSASNQF